MAEYGDGFNKLMIMIGGLDCDNYTEQVIGNIVSDIRQAHLSGPEHRELAGEVEHCFFGKVSKDEILDRLKINGTGHELPPVYYEEEEPDRFSNITTTFTADILSQKPVQKEMVLDRFPIGATSAVVAMGGVGKTTWLAREAIMLSAMGQDTVFITSEDTQSDYQAKLHNAILSTNSDIEQTIEDVADHIHVLNVRGTGIKLVVQTGGCYVPSDDSLRIATFISDNYKNVKLIIFETLSRFAGGEENERFEAAITACDAIATQLHAACVLVHHTGKGQARDKVIDLYSGRGGSSLGDNTRSMTVLARIDAIDPSDPDKGYAGELETMADHRDIKEKRVFEVNHVRNSYGQTKSPEYYVTRPGYCFAPILEVVGLASEDEALATKLAAIEAANSKTANDICSIIKEKGGKVSRRYFDKQTREKLGRNQLDVREIIIEMLEAGSLTETDELTEKGQNTKFLINSNQN